MEGNRANYCEVGICYTRVLRVIAHYACQFRNVPGSALYFFALSEVRQILANTRPTWQPMLNKVGADGKTTSEHQRWENLLSGSTARGAVGYIMMPITVVKVRYEVMPTKHPLT